MQINIRKTVSSLDTASETISAPLSGTVTQITIHFPPGANALVEVRVKHGGKNICPYNGYIALDDATPVFEVNEEVRAGDPLIAEFVNHDDTYDHTISVIITLIGRRIRRLL